MNVFAAKTEVQNWKAGMTVLINVDLRKKDINISISQGDEVFICFENRTLKSKDAHLSWKGEIDGCRQYEKQSGTYKTGVELKIKLTSKPLSYKKLKELENTCCEPLRNNSHKILHVLEPDQVNFLNTFFSERTPTTQEKSATKETEIISDNSPAIPGKPTIGIKPTEWTSEITRNLGNPSETYAMRYGKSDCWKIGHTKDVKQRLMDVNKHLPHEVTGEKWKFFYTQKYLDEVTAYQMEQKVLGLLAGHRTEGERVKCSEEILHEAWLKALV